jgi:3-methyladenine DNA glycosylase AlkD
VDVTHIVDELRALGSDSTKRVLLKHGAREPIFGVKVQDLKPIVRREKVNHELALTLYDTGISDAMYLAGLIADDPRMSQQDLQRWAEAADWSLLSESTVPWVASGGRFGADMATRWIESAEEHVAGCGWATFRDLVSVKPDAELDMGALKALLMRVETTLPGERNRVRYLMNGFVINVALHVPELTQAGLETARVIGTVSVDMGDTACKIPDAVSRIREAQERGVIGKKRKTAKC